MSLKIYFYVAHITPAPFSILSLSTLAKATCQYLALFFFLATQSDMPLPLFAKSYQTHNPLTSPLLRVYHTY